MLPSSTPQQNNPSLVKSLRDLSDRECRLLEKRLDLPVPQSYDVKVSKKLLAIFFNQETLIKNMKEIEVGLKAIVSNPKLTLTMVLHDLTKLKQAYLSSVMKKNELRADAEKRFDTNLIYVYPELLKSYRDFTPESVREAFIHAFEELSKKLSEKAVLQLLQVHPDTMKEWQGKLIKKLQVVLSGRPTLDTSFSQEQDDIEKSENNEGAETGDPDAQESPITAESQVNVPTKQSADNEQIVTENAVAQESPITEESQVNVPSAQAVKLDLTKITIASQIKDKALISMLDNRGKLTVMDVVKSGQEEIAGINNVGRTRIEELSTAISKLSPFWHAIFLPLNADEFNQALVRAFKSNGVDSNYKLLYTTMQKRKEIISSYANRKLSVPERKQFEEQSEKELDIFINKLALLWKQESAR